MAAASYKLTYFDIRGLAELNRLVLTASGVNWTDDRIPFTKKADGSFDRGNWESELKAKTPYGSVPVLTYNGVQIPQSAAIMRFVANKTGLAGSNEIETAQIDAAFEHILDIRKGFFSNKADAAKLADFWNKSFPEQVAALNKNVTGSPFFASKMSYADIAIYYTLYVLGTENAEAVEKAVAANSKVASIRDAVAKDPKIAAYLAARKVTIF